MVEFIQVSVLNILAKILKFLFEIGTNYFVDKETYGYFAILLSYMMIFTRVSVFGIPNLMVRELAKSNNSIYNLNLLFNSLLIVTSIVLIGFLSIKLFHLKYLYDFYESIFIVWFVSIISLYASFFRVNGYIKLWIFFQDISWYIFYFVGLGVLFLLNKNPDINSILNLYLFSVFFSFLWLFFFLKNKFDVDIFYKVSFVKIKYILSQSFPILFTGLTYLILARIDVIMLGNYVDLAIVGEYNIIVRVTVQTLFVYQVMSSYFYPKLAKKFIKKEKYENVARYVTRFIIISVLSVVFLNLILYILIEKFNLFNIMGIVYSREFFFVFVIFALTQIAYSAIGVYGYILLYIHKQKIEYINNIVILFIGIGLNYVFIPEYGVIGAALASAIAILIGNLLEFVEVRYLTGKYFIQI